MKKRLFAIGILTAVLALAMIVLSPDSPVYGKGKGMLPSRYRALPAAARGMAERAKTELAKELAVPGERIAVASVDGANFEDSSLGTIEPGQRYLEGPTPGYVIRFFSDGTFYTYRGSGDRLVPEAWTPEERSEQTLIRKAVQDIRSRLDVRLEEVVLERIDPMVFPDGSLGAPEPNVPFAMAPTPGHEIALQVKGVTYRYWAANERVVYVGSIVEATRTVTVYLFRDGESVGGCAPVYPVQRSVPVSAQESGEIALQQLFAGPTQAELAAGYSSLFSADTRDMLQSVRVEGRTAYLDLADLRSSLPMTAACDRQVFLGQVEATLRRALPVEWVAYTIEGDPLAFCEWMDLGCTRSEAKATGR